MAWSLNPWASAGYAAMLAAWTLGLVVLFAGQPTRQTRTLALLLGLEGFTVAGGFAIIWSTNDFASAYGWQMVGLVGWGASAGVYLLFLGTLPSPLARPLRSRPGMALAVLATASLAALSLLRPELVAAGMILVWWAPWEVVPGPLWDPYLMAASVPSLYAIAVAIDLRRRTAAGSDARRRATLYLAAFGVRDLFYGLLFFTTPLWFQRLQPASDLFVILVLPLASLAFCVLLAYGLLRAQLFDIDLRLRNGLRHGTVAGAFLGVFFVVASVSENYLSETFGYLAGGGAAGLLLFALAPLQRVAERVASTAVPESRVTPEYLAFRKLEVYKAAVESAHETGGITQKERLSLERLREKLRLAEPDARAVEADVVG